MNAFRVLISHLILLLVLPQTVLADSASLAEKSKSELLELLKNQPEGSRAYRFKRQGEDEEKSSTFTLILNKNHSNSFLAVKKSTDINQGEKRYPLKAGQIENLTQFEKFSNFWSLPEKQGKVGFDGAYWQLEGARGTEYHKTTRWSPLPPYYSSVMDKNGKIVKSPRTPAGSDSKYSDEVGLDMFCLLIMLTEPEFSEELY